MAQSPLCLKIWLTGLSAHHGSILLAPRFTLDILTSQIRETWALRRALVAQREDDGGHDGVCLNRFNLMQSHGLIVIYQNHVEIVPWPSIEFATGSWHVCILIFPVFASLFQCITDVMVLRKPHRGRRGQFQLRIFEAEARMARKEDWIWRCQA